MMMLGGDDTKILLYVEECENDFINSLLSRKDFQLIILRFKQNMDFSEEHLEKSKRIPIFILDKKENIDKECERFSCFLSDIGCDVDYFYNDSEYNQEYVQQFARKLKIPGALTENQALFVRDKYFMKKLIRDIGYECTDYELLNSKEEAVSFAEQVGYPFIIKWRRGVSSIEVYKISSKEELENLKLDYRKKKYMGESFCSWRIWCLDSIVSEGKVINNLFTWLPYTNLEFTEQKESFAQIAIGNHPANWKFSPYKLTSDIVNALGVKRGFLHLEVFIDDRGNPIICEFGWRTPGDHMLLNYSRVYGVSIPDLLLDVLLGKNIPVLRKNDNVVADVFLPIKEGIISYITPIEEMKDNLNIIDGEVFYSIGQKVQLKRKYTDCSGWVQIKTSNMSSMLQRIQEVYENYRMEVSEINEKGCISNK